MIALDHGPGAEQLHRLGGELITAAAEAHGGQAGGTGESHGRQLEIRRIGPNGSGKAQRSGIKTRARRRVRLVHASVVEAQIEYIGGIHRVDRIPASAPILPGQDRAGRDVVVVVVLGLRVVGVPDIHEQTEPVAHVVIHPA